jgi:hypothetical protein
MIAGAILRSTTLQSVDFAWNVGLGPDGIAPIAEAVAKSASMMAMEFLSCQKDKAGFGQDRTAVANMIRLSKSLTSVDLSCCFLTDQECDGIVRSLGESRSMQSLALPSNSITPAGLTNLEAALWTSATARPSEMLVQAGSPKG